MLSQVLIQRYKKRKGEKSNIKKVEQKKWRKKLIRRKIPVLILEKKNRISQLS
jgi:hypothetical protein